MGRPFKRAIGPVGKRPRLQRQGIAIGLLQGEIGFGIDGSFRPGRAPGRGARLFGWQAIEPMEGYGCGLRCGSYRRGGGGAADGSAGGGAVGGVCTGCCGGGGQVVDEAPSGGEGDGLFYKLATAVGRLFLHH